MPNDKNSQNDLSESFRTAVPNISSSAADDTRTDLAFEYLEQLPYEPYPFQEQAILAWFESKQGVLVCAPTGMGKTVVAEAGLFEALKTGKKAYYTTPLIALTEQKYREIQESAERWGFSRNDVGLVTGNRRENPGAKILVVVAEILFNRILSSDLFRPSGLPETKSVQSSNVTNSVEEPRFNFEDVSVVVMDEFHNFSDPERGIVWEFSLELLPPQVRTLLISATVGNAYEFVSWLRNTAQRRLDIIESQERKVPLVYNWVGDKFLTEHLEWMHSGNEEERYVPALVFCFNRDECWDVAEQIRGRNIIDPDRQKQLADELEKHDWTKGAGPKLRQLLLRGVGVHHAGILPKYRRIVEDLFQRKLLSITVCTETLAAGINLPARSVVLPSLMKGPAGDKKQIDSSSAHQIFGRAGRPQFDDRGYVFVLAHEDDVRIARFREKYDQIPEDTKDPKLREAKKKLKKKMPTRNPNEQYWSEEMFNKIRNSSPGSLTSRGPLPWRLLAHMIESNSDLQPVRTLAAYRLMGYKRLSAMQKDLDSMLLTLWRAGFIRLEPHPNEYGILGTDAANEEEKIALRQKKEEQRKSRPFGAGLFDDAAFEIDFNFDDSDSRSGDNKKGVTDNKTSANLFGQGIFDSADKKADSNNTGKNGSSVVGQNSDMRTGTGRGSSDGSRTFSEGDPQEEKTPETYKAQKAFATDRLKNLVHFRGVNPIFGTFLLEQLGRADRGERIQAFESILEMPATAARYVRVPAQRELPPGKLAQEELDKKLLEYGLATIDELVEKSEEEKEEEWRERRRLGSFAEERVFVIDFAEKLLRLFDYEYPGVRVRTSAVWAAGPILLDYNGDFNKFIIASQLQKQEGIIFRHLLRLILLLEEFHDMIPEGTTKYEWQTDLEELGQMLVNCCRTVDPTSTEETLKVSQRKELADTN